MRRRLDPIEKSWQLVLAEMRKGQQQMIEIGIGIEIEKDDDHRTETENEKENVNENEKETDMRRLEIVIDLVEINDLEMTKEEG